MEAGGFITLHRKLLDSPVWLTLTEGQRCAFVAMLLLANWKPGRGRWGTQWYAVGRGELSFSMASIASKARVSPKVVRSTVNALLADGTLLERYPLDSSGSEMGTGVGTGPRVLTFANYSQYQDTPKEEGTAMGTGRARVGHRGKQGNKGTKKPYALRAVGDPFPTNPPPPKPLPDLEQEYLNSPERLAWLASQNGGAQ